MIQFEIRDHPDQQFSTIIENRRVTLRLRYNVSSDRWSFDLSLDDQPVLHGRRIVTGINLLAPFNLGLGVIFAAAVSPGAEPDRAALPAGTVGLFSASDVEVEQAKGTLMLQYLRKVRATFAGGFVVNPGGINLHDLMISFSIEKDLSSSANSAEITIWNLAEDHRNAVGKVFDQITLEAGYMPPRGDGNVGIIFKGAVRDVEHTRDGPNIKTTINCGDGSKALRKATISKSFPKGTPVKDVVEELYKEMEKQGVKRGEWKFPDDMPEKFKRPYATCGLCRDELDTIGRGNKFYWSLQNETMEVVPSDGYVGGVVQISPETGMIGTPAITDNGVRVSALLNPEVRPGRRIQVKSETLRMNAADSMYRVSSVTFSGDNHKGEFKMDIDGEALGGGKKVDEGFPK